MGPSPKIKLHKTEIECRPSLGKQKWLSTKEAAYYLRISPNALRIMVHRDKVKAYKLGNRLRFLDKDIETLLGE